MTSPGGSSGITAPDDSVSSTGASSLQTNTQTNVVNRKKAEVKSSAGWNNASDTLFGVLFGGFIQGITGFISFLVFALKGITGGLIDLTGSLKNTQNTATNAQNTATGAVQQVAVVTQKIVAFDIKSPRPGWESINPTEYPSFPYALLLMGYRISGSNSNPNIARAVDPDTSAAGSTNFVAAKQFYAFIRVPTDGELTGLNFYAKGAPSALHVRVHPMSAAGPLLSALTPESPSLHAGLLTTQHTAVAWTFPAPLIVEAGSWVAIGFRCVGSCALAAQELFDPQPIDGFYPVKRAATTARASGVALPESVPLADMTWVGTTPYVAIGNNILEIPNKRNLSDNFDRPDTGGYPTIGPNWSYRTTRGFLDSSGIYIKDNAIKWSGGDNGSAEYTWTQPLTTESVISYVHVGDPQPTAHSTFFVAANSTGTSGLTVGFREDGIGLWKKGGPGINSGTVIIPLVARTVAYGDSIALQEGETDPITEIFNPEIVLVRHNGVEIIRTTVTSATVPRGKGNRYCGCGGSRTPFQNSTPILDWQAYDVPDVEVVTP